MKADKAFVMWQMKNVGIKAGRNHRCLKGKKYLSSFLYIIKNQRTLPFLVKNNKKKSSPNKKKIYNMLTQGKRCAARPRVKFTPIIYDARRQSIIFYGRCK